MFTLITYPAGFGTLSMSPFCVKAMYLLNAAPAAWNREDRLDPRRMPRAKLPVLRTPDGLVHDSDGIMLYLERQGAEFMPGLSARDQAQSRAMVRMAEEHLYFLLVLDRWERPEVWPVIRDTYFAEIPWLLRGWITGRIRRAILDGLRAQGLGRLTWDERMMRLEQDLVAISAQLGNRAFLFGHVPTLADAAVVPMLDAMRSTPFETPMVRRISGDAQLCAYIDRGHAAMAPA